MKSEDDIRHDHSKRQWALLFQLAADITTAVVTILGPHSALSFALSNSDD